MDRGGIALLCALIAGCSEGADDTLVRDGAPVDVPLEAVAPTDEGPSSIDAPTDAGVTGMDVIVPGTDAVVDDAAMDDVVTGTDSGPPPGMDVVTDVPVGADVPPVHCVRPVEVVTYTEAAWDQIADAMQTDPSPCADYYISIPALAADKTQPRASGVAAAMRARGPRFHPSRPIVGGHSPLPRRPRWLRMDLEFHDGQRRGQHHAGHAHRQRNSLCLRRGRWPRVGRVQPVACLHLVSVRGAWRGLRPTVGRVCNVVADSGGRGPTAASGPPAIGIRSRT